MTQQGQGDVVARFRISYRDGGYCVSVPNYDGGEVVDAKAYDAALAEITRLRTLLSSSRGEQVAYRHCLVEHDGQEQVLLSLHKENPWSHWVESHLNQCTYSVTPLYALPSAPGSVPTSLAGQVPDVVSEIAAILDKHQIAMPGGSCSWSLQDRVLIACRAANSDEPPDGYVLVPKEPTADMAEVARDWAQRDWKAFGDPKGYLKYYQGIYRAMLSASPQPIADVVARVEKAIRSGFNHNRDIDCHENSFEQLMSDIMHCVRAALQSSPQPGDAPPVENRQWLIDAVANAHIGCRMDEPDALALLKLLGVDPDEADDLLTAQREEAGQP